MFIFYHLEVLEGSFADVDDTWMRDQLVITFLSLVSLFVFSPHGLTVAATTSRHWPLVPPARRPRASLASNASIPTPPHVGLPALATINRT